MKTAPAKRRIRKRRKSVAAAPVIRNATTGDAARLSALGTELGYPSTPAEMKSRLRLALKSPDQATLVAESAGVVAGWLQIIAGSHLISGRDTEIISLVVTESARGRGIGTLLLRAAEGWARRHGSRAIRVRSNVIRTRARKFYLDRDYELQKVQNVFRKQI
jgi:GNAT superfamily N-acetyltransferase